MRIKGGNDINREFTVDSDPKITSGNRAVAKMITTIIILKAIIKYLNFNGYSPIITYGRIIKERWYCVNDAGQWGLK